MLFIIVLLYNVIILYMLWLAVRSLMKKSLNLPPCGLFWAKISVETVSEKDILLAGEYKADPLQDMHYHISGKRYSSVPTEHTAKYSKLKYVYDGKSYELKTTAYSSGDIGTGIYCFKGNPAITKIFKLKPALMTEAAIGMMFAAGFMILCEIAVLL